MGSGFASAVSEHPLPTHAVGEVVGQVLDAVGEAPDLAVLFATTPHVGAFEDMAAAVRATLRPGTLVGTTAVAVAAADREVEDVAAVALWAGRVGPVRALPIDAHTSVEHLGLAGDETLLVLADPFTTPVPELLTALAGRHPGVRVTGGLASAGRGPGGNRVVIDAQVRDQGGACVVLRPDQCDTPLVSQGCRPVGDPFTVTEAQDSLLVSLGGRPALERLAEMAERVGPDDRQLLQQGIHLGIVIDEQRERFERGDFLVRNVLGADRERGIIAVGGEVPVGATVQFHVRDAASADEDLRLVLAGQRAEGALLFTCNGRGTRLFGVPDHDAALVHGALGEPAVAGMACAGELGPIGGRSFLHGFTASVVRFLPHDTA